MFAPDRIDGHAPAADVEPAGQHRRDAGRARAFGDQPFVRHDAGDRLAQLRPR